ncbi:MAG: HD domain-containing protein [Holophagales bacterium]|nr:HD domain-containing protein [Holophagales bacterium]
MRSIRDPIHGFIRTDELETALLASRPMQRLRFIHQLGLTFLVFPGAEHSRFSHALGVMHLAGRIYDALAAKDESPLPAGGDAVERRLVRVAALLHDIGHAPFSHTAEDLFEGGIDHEDMTLRLLDTEEMRTIFEEHGNGVGAEAVKRILQKRGSVIEQLLSEIVTSELDVDKMDYLRRDSLYCGVQYGSYDLQRLIEMVEPVKDPEDGRWRIGVGHGGVHALEALVMARYYMFTQVYFNVTSKVMELHFNHWLRREEVEWPQDPEAFLERDDLTVLTAMRRSKDPHARAIVHRERYSLAYETDEHLSHDERGRFMQIIPKLESFFGEDQLLVDNSAKDPHRLEKNRVWVRRFDGSLRTMAQASDFIGQLSRIDCFRVYAPKAIQRQVAAEVERLWQPRPIRT